MEIALILFINFLYYSLLIVFCIYIICIYKINKSYYKLSNTKSSIFLRKFPYPYKAALAIASDIDSTSTLEKFLEIQEFLNTKNITNMGEGVGLDIGNSFFMFHPKNKFSYFSTREEDRVNIRKFI